MRKWIGRAVWAVVILSCCLLHGAPDAPRLNAARELSVLTPELQADLVAFSETFRNAAEFSISVPSQTRELVVAMTSELWTIPSTAARRELLARRQFRALLPAAIRSEFEKAIEAARTATEQTKVLFPEHATEAIMFFHRVADDLEFALRDKLAQARPSADAIAAHVDRALEQLVTRTKRIAQARLILDAPRPVLKRMGIDADAWRAQLEGVLESEAALLAAVRRSVDDGTLKDVQKLREKVDLRVMDQRLASLVGKVEAWLTAPHRAPLLQIANSAAALSTRQRFPEIPATKTSALRLRFRIEPATKREPTISAVMSVVQDIPGAVADSVKTAVKESYPVEIEIPTGVKLTHLIIEKPKLPDEPPIIKLTPTTLVTTVGVDKRIATDLLRQIGVPTVLSASVTAVDVSHDLANVSVRFRYSLPEVSGTFEAKVDIVAGVSTLEKLGQDAFAEIKREFEKQFEQTAKDVGRTLANKLGLERIRGLRLDSEWSTTSLGGTVHVRPFGWTSTDDLQLRFRIELENGLPHLRLASATVPSEVQTAVLQRARQWLETRISAIPALQAMQASLVRFLAFVTVKDLRFDATTRRMSGLVTLSDAAQTDWFVPLEMTVGPTELAIKFDEQAFAKQMLERLPATLARLTGFPSEIVAFTKGKVFTAFGFEFEVQEEPVSRGRESVFSVIARHKDASATLRNVVFLHDTAQLDFSRAEVVSPTDFAMLIAKRLPQLPQSALRISAVRFASNVLMFELAFHVPNLSFDLPLGEIRVGAKELSIALPPDLSQRVVHEVAHRLPTLDVALGQYGKLDNIKIDSVKLTDPIEVWISGRASLSVLSTTVKVRVAPSFQVKFEQGQNLEAILFDALKAIGLEFLKEVVPCPGIDVLHDAIGFVCPSLDFKLRIVGDEGFAIHFENVRVTTTGVQAPESFGISVPISAIGPLPFDLWLVQPRFQFHRIRKELTVSADITWGTPEAASFLKLTADLTAPPIPTRFELVGRLILGGFLDLAHTRGSMDFQKAEAKLSSQTVGPLTRMLDLHQELHFLFKQKLIHGNAHVRVLSIELLNAKLLIDGNAHPRIEFKAALNLPLVGDQAFVVEAPLSHPLDSRVGFDFAAKLGPFTLASARFFIAPMFARVTFTVLGLPFTIEMPHVWAITSDMVLQAILSAFDFDPAAILNFFKNPQISFGLKGGDGTLGGEKGSEEHGTTTSKGSDQNGPDGPKGGRTTENRNIEPGTTEQGSGNSNDAWNVKWGDIGFTPIRPPYDHLAAIEQGPRRAIIGGVVRAAVDKAPAQGVRVIDRFEYVKPPCVRDQTWTITPSDGRAKKTFADCQWLLLLGADNRLYVLSMAEKWERGILSIPETPANIIGPWASNLYNDIVTIKLTRGERRRLRKLARYVIEDSTAPRDFFSWPDTAAPDNNIPLLAGTRYMLPAAQDRNGSSQLWFQANAANKSFFMDMNDPLFQKWAAAKPDFEGLRHLYRLWANSEDVALISFVEKGSLLAVAKRDRQDTLWLVSEQGLLSVGTLVDATGPEGRQHDRIAAQPPRTKGTIEPFSIPYWGTPPAPPPRADADADDGNDPDADVQVSLIEPPPSAWWSTVIDQLAEQAGGRVFLLAPDDLQRERRMLIWTDSRSVVMAVQPGTTPTVYSVSRSRFDANVRRARGATSEWLKTMPVKGFGTAKEARERELSVLLFLPGDEWRPFSTTNPLALFQITNPTSL